ncbi:hypothetical protein BH10CYA1_BH10CYA1_17460 [soil metagenome]
MSNNAAEHAEHQITKGDSHHGAHTANLQQEAQSLLGGLANNVKQAAQDVQHLDFSDPFKAAGSAIAKGADQAWHDLDKNKMGSYFKNDIAHNDPVKAVVYGTAIVGVGALAVAITAPEAIAAAGVSAFATGTLGGAAALNGAAQYGWDAVNKK